MWLDATRVSTAPGRGISRRTVSPVATTASDRVVGMPSAAIASLMMYSRRTGPSAARPSPIARERRGAGALELDVAAHAVGIDDLAEKNGPAVAELRHEMAELVAGIGHGEGLAELGHPVARKDRHALRRGKQIGIEPRAGGRASH